ncbi:MAG: Ger(x)C family spore germination C-terminal domain-containing protein [Oscillospiraceae bacterium]|nr:Ger(x)C family spore germination C-terminal domain-containing protein [Oscillospiraceae bacterium]
MKKVVSIIKITLSLVLLTAFLSGCNVYTPYIRLEQRIMVQLVGVDYDDGVYTVSAQFSMGKSSDGGKTENDLKTVTGKGANIYSAMRQARTSIGKEFFFAHNQVLFLGEGVLKNNSVKVIQDYLTYFNNHSTAYVAGVYGTAEELLSLTYKDEYTDKNKLLLILENANDTGIYPTYCTIYRSLMFAYGKSGANFIPMVKILETGESDSAGGGAQAAADESSSEQGGEEGGDSGGGSDGGKPGESNPRVIADGGALLIDGSLVTFMDSEQCAGLALLCKDIKMSSVELNYNNEVISIELFGVKPKIVPIFESFEKDGVLAFHIVVRAVVDKSGNRILTEPGINADKVKALVEEQVQSKITSTVDTVQSVGGDLFNLEDVVKHYDYAMWIKAEDEWRDLIKTAEFTYSIDISII